MGDAIGALIALAERCEAAAGPDRLIDAMITKHFRLYRSLTDPIADDRWIELREEDGRLLMHVPGDLCAPYGYRGLPFTSSLDAAMTLVPEGWGWSVDQGYTFNREPHQTSVAFCLHPDRLTRCGLDRRGDGATAALALCAAALRARAAIAIEAGTGGTAKTGPTEGESAGPKDIAQNTAPSHPSSNTQGEGE